MKSIFSSILKVLPKKLFAALLIALAIALPVASFAADSVRLEGSLGVANVTAGDTQYKKSVNASYDQVVKLQVFYHNRENENSGKVANNLRVKINIPTATGKNQVVRSTISADNANTINDQVAVNLNRDDAQLEYIPGSAVWRHNAGTNDNVNFVEQKISDAVVTSGQGLVLENAKPCFNFAATVTVLARVRVPSVSITKQVRHKGEGKAVTQLNAKAGDKVEYLLTSKNLGNSDLTNVVLRDKLPNGVTFVPGTVKLFNGPNPNGKVIDNDFLFKGGVNAGTVGPGATVFVTFEAQVNGEDKLECGVNSLKNTAVVDTDQTGEYNNTATVVVEKKCQPEKKPKYSCDLLELKQLGGRKVRASVNYTAENGATFDGVTYNFGDGSEPLVTDKTAVEYEYAKDGTYNVAATVRFSVNGVQKTDTNENCAKTVTFESGKPVPPTPKPETPAKELPNTGAGDVLGLVAAVTIAGALAHKFVYGRRSV